MEGDLFHSPMPEKVSLQGSADFFVNVSFEEPKDKNLTVGGKKYACIDSGLFHSWYLNFSNGKLTQDM
jgi:hypothetical protein